MDEVDVESEHSELLRTKERAASPLADGDNWPAGFSLPAFIAEVEEAGELWP